MSEYIGSNYGSAPTPPVRKQGSRFSVPFMWQDPPRRTTHLEGVEPHPALPAIRRLGAGSLHDNVWDDAVVIEQGEPVGLYVDPDTNRTYIVPATGGGSATVTYGSYDIEQAIEDLDSPGNPVESTGTSSATLPAVIPIGVSMHPVVRNFSYTTGIPHVPGLYANYSPDKKPVIARDGVCEIPWYRYGPKAIVDANSGKYVVPGELTNVSATNRPYFQTANMVSTGAGNATAATATLTVAVGNGVTANETLTINHMGNSYQLTAVANGTTPDLTAGEFEIGADNNATAANIKATIDAYVGNSSFTTSIVDNVVTLTSTIAGDEGNFDPDIVDGNMTDLAAAESDATDGDASFQLGHDAKTPFNFAQVLGKILQVRTNLSLNGEKPGLAHTVTTPNMGLTGRDTGGVPATLNVKGNSAKGNQVPNDYLDAGALRILID